MEASNIEAASSISSEPDQQVPLESIFASSTASSDTIANEIAAATTSLMISDSIESGSCRQQFENMGTRDVPFKAYELKEDGFFSPHLSRYQTITFQEQYRNYSVEELRHFDYEQSGRYNECREIFSQYSISTQTCHNLHLLQGEVIKIIVGPTEEGTRQPQIWYLPKALLISRSEFFSAACTLDFKEKEENQILLPEDDPAIFALFVSFLYYGSYTPVQDFRSPDAGTIDAAAWVFGDKCLTKSFKNHAMRRLYTRYVKSSFRSPVSPAEVNFACENSVSGSKIRQFLLDFVVSNFSKPEKVHGSDEEWAELMQNHNQIGIYVLRGLRASQDAPKYLREVEYYLDT